MESEAISIDKYLDSEVEQRFDFLYENMGTSNPTMNKAINNITIAKAVDEGYLDEDFFEDTDNPDELVKRVTIYHKVSIDYQSFTSTITKAEKKEKQEKAPALFDLASLQREANKRLGYTAHQTLDYTQSLYEKKLVYFLYTPFQCESFHQVFELFPSYFPDFFCITGPLEPVLAGQPFYDHTYAVTIKNYPFDPVCFSAAEQEQCALFIKIKPMLELY